MNAGHKIALACAVAIQGFTLAAFLPFNIVVALAIGLGDAIVAFVCTEGAS